MNAAAAAVRSAYRSTGVNYSALETVGWLGFNGNFSTNRLCRAIKKDYKFVEDVYFG